MFYKKSQSATEYIIILSIVLVITAIVVTSLSGVNLIGSNFDELDSQKIWQNNDIAITSIAFINDDTSSDDAKMTILNNFDTTIRIEQINISQNNKDQTTIDLGISAFTLDPGQEQTLSLNLNTNNPCYNKQSGDNYDIAIVFKYVDEEIEKTYYYRGGSVRLKGICATS
jgi:hypothetical protein